MFKKTPWVLGADSRSRLEKHWPRRITWLLWVDNRLGGGPEWRRGALEAVAEVQVSPTEWGQCQWAFLKVNVNRETKSQGGPRLGMGLRLGQQEGWGFHALRWGCCRGGSLGSWGPRGGRLSRVGPEGRCACWTQTQRGVRACLVAAEMLGWRRRGAPGAPPAGQLLICEMGTPTLGLRSASSPRGGNHPQQGLLRSL